MDQAALPQVKRAVGRVEIEGSRGWTPFGTGFVVAARAALTALHVVADRSAPRIAARGPIRLVLPGGPIGATLAAWDVDADWALLTLETPADAALSLDPTLPEEPEGWWAFGYPGLNQQDGVVAMLGLRDTHAAYDRGTAVSLQSEDLKGTEVRGLSGGPLLRGAVVHGIFRSNLEEGRRSFGYLYATPIAAVADRIDLPTAQPNPYQGMRPFDLDKAAFFFGRDEEAESLVRRLASDRMAVLVGGSGSGKSSLLGAGLLPRVGWIAENTAFEVVTLRPGARPVQELALALFPRLGFTGRPATLEALRNVLDGGGLSDLVDQELHHRHGGDRSRGAVLLVVDQLEELYASDADPEEVRRFLRAICAAGTVRGGRVWVVGAIRDGFMAELLRPGPDTEALRRALVPVGPIATEARLKELVVRPAERVGLRFDPPDLPDRIARDAADEPGGLPLLQYALDRLWQERRGNVLREEVYVGFGGVRGVIAYQADTAMGVLDDAGRDRARRLFLRLVWIRSDGPNTRRLLPYESLPADVRELAFRFVAARLLVTTAAGVEIAHEALIREWAPLRSWVKDAPEGERRLQELEAARLRWQEGGERPGDLLPTHRLQPLADWALTHPADLPPAERRFLVENLLEAGLPPEAWGPRVGAEALWATLAPAAPDWAADRPPHERLALIRALYAAGENPRSELEALLVRTAAYVIRAVDGRARWEDVTFYTPTEPPVSVPAARLGIEREGARWFVDLVDRNPGLLELLTVLLGDPEVRPALVDALPRAWGGRARRRAAVRLWWQGRTTILLVATTVFVALALLSRLWWLVDAAVTWAGLDRRDWHGQFGMVNLPLLAAFGAWFGQWRRVVRRRPRLRELAAAALTVLTIDRGPILLANLRQFAAGGQSLGLFAFLLTDNAVALVGFTMAVHALVVPREAGPWDPEVSVQRVRLVPKQTVDAARKTAWLIATTALGLTPALLRDRDVAAVVAFALNGLQDLATLATAAGVAWWAAHAATRPTFEGPPLAPRPLAGWVLVSAALFLGAGAFGRLTLPHLVDDIIPYAELRFMKNDDEGGFELLEQGCADGQARACTVFADRVWRTESPEWRTRATASAELGCNRDGGAACESWASLASLIGDERAWGRATVTACERNRQPETCRKALEALPRAKDDPDRDAWADALCTAGVGEACVLVAAREADPGRLATVRARGCAAGAVALCEDAPPQPGSVADRVACAAKDEAACRRLDPEEVRVLAANAGADAARYLLISCFGGSEAGCAEFGAERARERRLRTALTTIPPDVPVPEGYSARRLLPQDAPVPLDFPDWTLSFDGSGSADLFWNGPGLNPRWCDPKQPDTLGLLLPFTGPLPVTGPPPGLDTAAWSFLDAASPTPGNFAGWCEAAHRLVNTSIEPVLGGTYLFRTWRRGGHDLLLELRTWPLADGSLVIAWRTVREWTLSPEFADAP